MEDFLTKEEIDLLRGSCQRIVAEMNPEDHSKVAFRTDEDQVGGARCLQMRRG